MVRKTFLASAALLVLAVGARASDPVGIYALIDKVVLEPKEGAPERIQIWGVFTLSRNYGNEHAGPVRGYMHFAATVGKEEVCRREWADLKRIAGTGQVVAFGSSRAPTGIVRKAATAIEPAAPLDIAKLQALIADLGNDDFAVRENASHALEQQGAHAHAELRKALDGKASPEARRRIEKLLPTDKPDPYPLGFGLTKLEGSHGAQWRNLLQSLPEPVAPQGGTSVETGKVTLRTKNVGCSDHRNATYVFEIEDASGAKETSSPIAAGQKETEWSPRLEVQAGKRYTWRVRPVDGEWKGPVAESSFQGKATR